MTIQNALAELTSLLGQGLSRSKSDLDQHGASESHFPLSPPDAVVYPESTEQLSDIVKICARHGCPLIGWGAGTSLEGQAQAFQGGVSVDFSNMNKLLRVSPEDMDVTVQPGMTREELNTELRATGLFFPVDPGANASIGGMASTRASGTTAVRYGTMRDNVLGLQVVLADGRIIHTGTRARKSSAGYDLTGLFVGAEGTLGLITELTLRLHGQPEAITAAVCAFDSIDDAVQAVIATIQMGIPIARIEFVDAATAAAFNGYSGSDMPLCPHLMVEFQGSEAGVAEQAEMFGDIVADHGGKGFEWATKPEERTALWKMRHHAHWAVLASKPGAKALVTDICVPISRLADAVNETRADIETSPISGPILGHVGDGNFHAILLFDDANPDEVKAVEALSHRMVERSLAMGGTATGEHGIGIGKKKYMEAEHGAAWDVMGDMKRVLDPQNIMNPGKMLRGN
ncbi:putative FAD-linked oxidoreductase [Thalassovita gelatinovora]|uniref:D-lactate dehydrogenase (cytochrome) n=1 Tax=Thalassovita gelatinovora TaxID=53501 RepID=A0A0P1G0S0_THAGE|nr:FAD-linked oxidase C-terminal domain-containing protein [Thalassovita gelatinovora]QIZ79943.1 FAD-binding protein [Thalassovita gelatinovora]CUH66468.1 putative FAD-linked oxidoreductase [Thalassovita gelatinovora]SER13571.1 D-lactate dehydrogenase (cytochrome) [Thalassovita gelatinovora]